MSRKVIEYTIDSAWETPVESQYTKSQIRVNVKNKHFILLEIDSECGIPGCKGTKCNPNQTTIAKLRRFHRGNNILKRRMKEKLLDEMPVPGKKVKKEEIFEVTKQEGDFEDDDEMDVEIEKFLKIQLEEKAVRANIELLEKRQRYIRLMSMWVKILDNYSKYLNENEIRRITEGLYFLRCEDFDGRQLIRLESRAINIIRSNTPVFIPNARKLPDSVLKVSLIDKRRWVDPMKVQRNNFYGTINEEIEDETKFNYLYNKAKEVGDKQSRILAEKEKEQKVKN